MAENTKIEWARHTFNPWVGCTKISPACDNCYAEIWAKRSGHPELWQGARRRTSPDNWKNPLKWNAAAQAAGERHRVFCASLADVFDNQVPHEWRIDLFALIRATPHLDWLLLTKRPQNIEKMLAIATVDFSPMPWPNVWLGVTAEDAAQFHIRYRLCLSKIPAVVRFVSYEPALERLPLGLGPHPDWIICGGETGHHPRLMREAWARALRDECAAGGIAFFMKQMTAKAPIPGDLMIRQFPRPRAA